MKYIFLLLFLTGCGDVHVPQTSWYLERTDGTIETLFIDPPIEPRMDCIVRKNIYPQSVYPNPNIAIINCETWKRFYKVTNGIKKIYVVCSPDYEKKWLDELPDHSDTLLFVAP